MLPPRTSPTAKTPTGNELGAAQQERAHEDLAQFAIGLDQGEQLLAIELDYFTRLTDAQAR